MPGEVVVEQICASSRRRSSARRCAPADDVLDPGDRCSRPTACRWTTVDDLVAALEDNEPGDTVELEIERPGTRRADGRGRADRLAGRSRAHDRRLRPVRHGQRRAAVRARHRHRPHRRPVGRAGVHADADRRAVRRATSPAAPTSPSPARSTSTAGRRDRRAGAEGVGRAPGRRRPTSSSRRRRARSSWQRARRDRRRRRRDHPGGHARRGPRRARAPRRRPARRAATLIAREPAVAPRLRSRRWPSRSRAPTRRRRRPWPRPRSAPPGAASTSRRCATSCAWSPPSWPGCRSGSGSSSASCGPPRRSASPTVARSSTTTR